MLIVAIGLLACFAYAEEAKLTSTFQADGTMRMASTTNIADPSNPDNKKITDYASASGKQTYMVGAQRVNDELFIQSQWNLANVTSSGTFQRVAIGQGVRHLFGGSPTGGSMTTVSTVNDTSIDTAVEAGMSGSFREFAIGNKNARVDIDRQLVGTYNVSSRFQYAAKPIVPIEWLGFCGDVQWKDGFWQLSGMSDPTMGASALKYTPGETVL
jgi:hypothetical protein